MNDYYCNSTGGHKWSDCADQGEVVTAEHCANCGAHRQKTCHSPAKGCPVKDCIRENGHVGFHIWERDTVSPAKDQATHTGSCFPIFPTGKCVYEDQVESVSGEGGNILCRCFCHRLGMLTPRKKYKGSCRHCTNQPQPEWEQRWSHVLNLAKATDKWGDVEDFIRAERQKEYERGRNQGELHTKVCSAYERSPQRYLR